jgi:anti-sigma factor RsiW
MTPTMHDPERLVELIDGRLSAAEEASVREHLASCPVCQAELARLERGRAALKAVGGPVAPPALGAAIAAALDREPRDRPRARRRLAISWGLAAAAVVLVALVGHRWLSPTIDPVDQVRTNADIVLAAATLETAFAQAGGPGPGFRVIDLAMMGWSLDGGMVTRVGDRAAALYAYRHTDGRRLVCQMYEGTLAALPPTSDVRRHREFIFHVYERDGTTLVFWQEGRIVCVLAGRLPTEVIVQLAFEKAMRPV